MNTNWFVVQISFNFSQSHTRGAINRSLFSVILISNAANLIASGYADRFQDPGPAQAEMSSDRPSPAR